ncbi:hypothetical protein E3N88_37581 [Mikania micrantha]|uniref:Bet v I/Major latex protein domain-containing protein n=1 Tax=Mikania micrantha TaxID=192012 RepID=A0A5N6LRI2_9ASTR|nr:hypothetical protein E3N88_37581 [Mikania micrantha]
MSLSGTLVKQITILSDGDVFHDIFRNRPHHISEMSPGKIKGVNLHDGDWGTIGSVIVWDFYHDGKHKVAKEVIEGIDEVKKSVCFRVIGGDILEAYKTFFITVHVDTHDQHNLVTWTFHYEKLNQNIEDPHTLMEFVLNLVYFFHKSTKMSLSGTLVKQTTILSDGDVFHDLFRNKPHHISEMSPDKIKGVGLHDGDWGTVGSVIVWDFYHVAKDVIEEIDEVKKSVSFRVIGGDLLETYKTFLIKVHVDTNGQENLVTWTFHYEKLNKNIEDPHTLMELALNLTKDIEKHHLPQAN